MIMLHVLLSGPDITWITVGSALGALLIAALLFILIRRYQKKKTEAIIEEKVKTSAKSIADKFGGRENILEIVQRGSRVVVTVKEPLLVHQKEIQEVVESVMFMSNKIVLVIGTKSEQFKERLEQSVGKTK